MAAFRIYIYIYIYIYIDQILFIILTTEQRATRSNCTAIQKDNDELY